LQLIGRFIEVVGGCFAGTHDRNRFVKGEDLTF
jgi:hypothetical protein